MFDFGMQQPEVRYISDCGCRWYIMPFRDGVAFAYPTRCGDPHHTDTTMYRWPLERAARDNEAKRS